MKNVFVYMTAALLVNVSLGQAGPRTPEYLLEKSPTVTKRLGKLDEIGKRYSSLGIMGKEVAGAHHWLGKLQESLIILQRSPHDQEVRNRVVTIECLYKQFMREIKNPPVAALGRSIRPSRTASPTSSPPASPGSSPLSTVSSSPLTPSLAARPTETGGEAEKDKVKAAKGDDLGLLLDDIVPPEGIDSDQFRELQEFS